MTVRQMRAGGHAAYGLGVLACVAGPGLLLFLRPSALLAVAGCWGLIGVGAYLIRWGTARAERAGVITGHPFTEGHWTNRCVYLPPGADIGSGRCSRQRWEHL